MKYFIEEQTESALDRQERLDEILHNLTEPHWRNQPYRRDTHRHEQQCRNRLPRHGTHRPSQRGTGVNQKSSQKKI